VFPSVKINTSALQIFAQQFFLSGRGSREGRVLTYLSTVTFYHLRIIPHSQRFLVSNPSRKHSISLDSCSQYFTA